MHTATDVVRTYEFTDAELATKLGIVGKIVGFGISPGFTRITTTMIHPEDARFAAPPEPGVVCRVCGAPLGQPCDDATHARLIPAGVSVG